MWDSGVVHSLAVQKIPLQFLLRHPGLREPSNKYSHLNMIFNV